MTSQATPDITERVSRLEGAYEQVNERLRDLTESVKALHSEMGSLKTTIIVIGGLSGRPRWAASSRFSSQTDDPVRRKGCEIPASDTGARR